MKPMLSFVKSARPPSPVTEQSFTRRLNRVVIIPALFMFALVGILLWQISYLTSVTQWVEHTDQVIVSISTTRKLMIDMETGVRGYLLVGDYLFLEPYEKAMKALPGSFAQTMELTKDNPQQQERLRKIRSDFADWQTYTVNMIRLRDTNNPQYKSLALGLEGKHRLDSLRQQINILQDREVVLRTERNTTVKKFIPMVILGSLGAAFLLGGVLTFLARKELFLLSDKYEEILETTFDQAEKLQQSFAQFRTLSDAMPQMVWTAKPNAEVDYINQRWMEYTGYVPQSQDNILFNLSQFLHPDDYEHTMQSWIAAVKTGSIFEVEQRLRRNQDQTYRWHLARAIPLRNEKGEIIKWFGTATDIDDQKRTMALLEQSNTEFQTLSNAVPEMIWTTDENGAVTYMNQRWYEYTGTTSEDNLGKGWKHVLHPEEIERVETTWMQSVRTGQIYDCEYRMRRGSDGTYRWHVARGIPLRNSTGQIIKWFGSNTDIDDQKHSEQMLQKRAQELFALAETLQSTTTNLEKRNRELDQFTYVISHDLKAPLRAIANLSHWIEEDISEHLSEENNQQMRLLRSRVQRMEEMINGLLQYSRVGRTESRYETIFVDSLLAEVIDSLDPPGGFRVEVGPDMPTMQGEAVLLRQVFANLIGNAIKHHHRAEGHIAVTAIPKGNFYEFAVKDDGPGIASAFHDKIFVIFQTLQARDTLESTGIGLSIVKKIVESQGGTIAVESEEGSGTTFRFTWPAKVVAQIGKKD